MHALGKSGLSLLQQSESRSHESLVRAQQIVSPRVLPFEKQVCRSSQQFEGLLSALHPGSPDWMHAFCWQAPALQVSFAPHALDSVAAAPATIEHVTTLGPSHLGYPSHPGLELGVPHARSIS